MQIVLTIVVILLFIITIFIIARLFAYIRKLEKEILKAIEFKENIFQSMKEIVFEGFLLPDGRLKKNFIQKDRNKIINGFYKVEEDEIDY